MCVRPCTRQGAFETNCHLRTLASLLSTLEQRTPLPRHRRVCVKQKLAKCLPKSSKRRRLVRLVPALRWTTRQCPAPCALGSQRPSHLRPFSPVTGPGGGGNYTPGTGPENGASDHKGEGLSGTGGAGARGRPAPAPCAPGSQRPSHLRPFSPVTGPGGGGNYTPGTGPENGSTTNFTTCPRQ